MGLLAVLVIFSVIARYFFSLSWKQLSEFNVTLFAFTTFWGMGINVLKGEHVIIDIVYDKVPPAIKSQLSDYAAGGSDIYLAGGQVCGRSRKADQPGHGDPHEVYVWNHACLRGHLRGLHCDQNN